MSPPLPEPGARWSLFLDLDGTLACLAPHPDDVRVTPERISALTRLEHALGGALAVVSGRSIDSIDRLLEPMRPSAAGLHGLEQRIGAARSLPADDGALDTARANLERFAATQPGLLLEDKGATLALHFRNAPALQAACEQAARVEVAQLPEYHVIAGKMVFEIKPSAWNKGTAIDSMLAQAPFLGGVPVFAGDDVTDEDGFRWVNANGGISVKVGEGETLARSRVDDVDALHGWLSRVRQRLERSAADTRARQQQAGG